MNPTSTHPGPGALYRRSDEAAAGDAVRLTQRSARQVLIFTGTRSGNPQEPSDRLRRAGPWGRWHALQSSAAATAAASLWRHRGTAVAETELERGRYPVESIMGCGNCQTAAKDPNGPVWRIAVPSGGPLRSRKASLHRAALNITPDPETGIGKWTDAQIKIAIREGKRPDGGLIGPPMPFG